VKKTWYAIFLFFCWCSSDKLALLAVLMAFLCVGFWCGRTSPPPPPHTLRRKCSSPARNSFFCVDACGSWLRVVAGILLRPAHFRILGSISTSRNALPRLEGSGADVRLFEDWILVVWWIDLLLGCNLALGICVVYFTGRIVWVFFLWFRNVTSPRWGRVNRWASGYVRGKLDLRVSAGGSRNTP